MTKREMKAVEITRQYYSIKTSSMSDDELLRTEEVKNLLKAMQWQAERSHEAFVNRWIPYLHAHGQDTMDASIINAGMEEHHD